MCTQSTITLLISADKGFKGGGGAVIPLIRPSGTVVQVSHKSTDPGRARMEPALCSPSCQAASTPSEYLVPRPPRG